MYDASGQFQVSVAQCPRKEGLWILTRILLPLTPTSHAYAVRVRELIEEDSSGGLLHVTSK